MKKIGVLFVFLIVLNCAFVSSSVSLNNWTFKQTYSPYQFIEGELNLTISDEEYDSVITSNFDEDNETDLGDFLDENGVDYECTPSDCSNTYSASSSQTEKTFSVSSNEIYGGFVLGGDNVEVTGLSFDIESDFSRGTTLPLRIEFFESDFWEFAEFSDEYSSENFGCYNNIVGIAGPLIRTSEYCEKVVIGETDSLEIGAVIDEGDTKNLKMTVYSDLSGSSLGECEFTPSLKDSCRVYSDSGSLFETGEYYICVSAVEGETTNYHLYSEFSDGDCGFVYPDYDGNSTKDYGIFVRTALYEAANTGSVNNLEIPEDAFWDFIDYANEIISERYGSDCSDGCVLPMKIKGTTQNLVLSNLVLDYSVNGEDQDPEENIYDLDVEPATVDFSGILNLELLGLEVLPGFDELVLFLNGDDFFTKSITVLEAPIIKFVYPVNPPAGVPVTFTALIDYSGNVSSYKWDFGDGSSDETSTGNKIVHAYDSIGNYTLELEVFAGNVSNSKKFSIETVSPEEALNTSLALAQSNFNNVTKDINTFPIWYQSALKKAVNLDFYQAELSRLQKDYENSFSDEEYVEVAIDLFELDFPSYVAISESVSGPLLTERDDIDATPVQMIGGGNQEDLDGYKNPILRWQSDNIASSVDYDIISMGRTSGESEDLLIVYDVIVSSSSSDESFFIIRKDFNDLVFNGDTRARSEGDSSAIVLNGEGQLDFEFYSLAEEGIANLVGMFISPALDRLVLEADIDTTCNYNNICEKENGENSSTCRNDCKPVGWMIFWLVMAFVFVLVVYTVLQVWYKTKYESSLFKDRRFLYNILMFVANARASGKGDSWITTELRKRKWSSEQINYVMKKSWGERTGMYEIIPIEKIFAKLRQRKANNNLSTLPQKRL